MSVDDIAALSEIELGRMVARDCSRFGSATILKVLLPDDHCDYAIVAVEMSNPVEAQSVAKALRCPHYDAIVIIKVAERE